MTPAITPKGYWLGTWAITGILAAYLAVMLFPYLWMVMMSLKPDELLFARPPAWLFEPILKHYREVFIEKEFARNILNSIIVAGASTLLVVIVGTPAAYSFARFTIKRSDDMFLFILASRMAPPISLAIPFYLLYSRVGLLNTYWGLILAYLTFNLSFYVWIMRSFFKEIPPEIEESAMIDGHTRMGAFFKVVLPLAKSGIASTGLLCFIFAWNEFLYAYVLGGGDVKTLPVAIPQLITTQGVLWGEMSSLGTVAAIPIIILVFFMQKHMLRGLTLGAVKG